MTASATTGKESGKELQSIFGPFFEDFRLRSVSKGQIILYPGDDPPGVIYLANGQLRQYDLTYKGNSIVVGLFRAPHLLPMSWVLNGTPNQYFFESATNVLYREAPLDSFKKFMEDTPEASQLLLRRAYEKNEATLSRMVHTLGSDAQTRLTYDLVATAHQIGVIMRDGSYVLLTSELEIANRVGLTRETISREVRKLKDMGLITSEHRKMIIPNIRALEESLINQYEAQN